TLFHTGSLGRDRAFVPREVGDAIEPLCASTAMAGGDAADVVAAGGLLQRLQQRLLWRRLGDFVETTDAHLASARGSGLVLANWHDLAPSSRVPTPARRCRCAALGRASRTPTSSRVCFDRCGLRAETRRTTSASA